MLLAFADIRPVQFFFLSIVLRFIFLFFWFFFIILEKGDETMEKGEIEKMVKIEQNGNDEIEKWKNIETKK